MEYPICTQSGNCKSPDWYNTYQTSLGKSANDADFHWPCDP